jgi:hypothetical protein
LCQQILLQSAPGVGQAGGFRKPDKFVRQPIGKRIEFARDRSLNQGHASLAKAEDAQRTQELAQGQTTSLLNFREELVGALFAKPHGAVEFEGRKLIAPCPERVQVGGIFDAEVLDQSLNEILADAENVQGRKEAVDLSRKLRGAIGVEAVEDRASSRKRCCVVSPLQRRRDNTSVRDAARVFRFCDDFEDTRNDVPGLYDSNLSPIPTLSCRMLSQLHRWHW